MDKLKKGTKSCIQPVIKPREQFESIVFEATPLKDFMKESLVDKELKIEYDNLEFKYDLIRQLLAYRRNHNITQKEFAATIGLEQQAISRFEKGEIDPRMSFVQKIINGMSMKITIDENTTSLTKSIIHEVIDSLTEEDKTRLRMGHEITAEFNTQPLITEAIENIHKEITKVSNQYKITLNMDYHHIVAPLEKNSNTKGIHYNQLIIRRK